jgi:drug/metabolite transporter (DMT)-like permease
MNRLPAERIEMGVSKGKPEVNITAWIFLGILSHGAWGGYPVFARFLQNVHHIGTMSLAAMTNTLATVVVLVFLIKKIHLSTVSRKDLVTFTLIFVARGLTNLYASRFTFATTVQLISLLTPFIVAFMSKTMYKEPLPRHTITALSLSLAGSTAMILGAGPGAPAGTILGNTAGEHMLGIALALTSSILLAFYMLTIKDIGRKGTNAETLAFIQFAGLGLCMGAGSLLVGESWKPWLVLPPSGFMAYLGFAFGVLLFGTIVQNNALRRLGAPAYATLQASRLLSTIGLSWIMLGEGIESLWQAAGTLTVMATITWFTYSQKRERDKLTLGG